MAKKKTKHINKITPSVSNSNGVEYKKLSVGECFLIGDNLYMKEGEQSDGSIVQSAVNLATGVFEESLCDSIVTPVTISISWKKK